MAHHPSPPSDDADRGTQLGSATRVLARVFTASCSHLPSSARHASSGPRGCDRGADAGRVAHRGSVGADRTLVRSAGDPRADDRGARDHDDLSRRAGSGRRRVYLPFAAARLIWRWIALPIRYLERLLVAAITSLLRMLARWTDTIGQWLAHRNRQLAHSVGVAFLRARARAADVAATDASAVDIPHPSTVAPHDLPFEIVAYQNEYLPSGATEVHAIIEVVACGAHSADRDASRSGGSDPARLLGLDGSAVEQAPRRSARDRRRHRRAARRHLVRDRPRVRARRTGVPGRRRPGAGDEHHACRGEGRAPLALAGGRYRHGSSGCCSRRDLFASLPSAIPHAILLTDGKNESESPASLEAALGACSGQFQCDCRGIGTDWNVGELRAISTRLLGTRRHRPGSHRARRRLPGDGRSGDGQGGGGSDAPGVDAAGREGPVHQAGRAHDL